MNYVYRDFMGVFTVGFYDPTGKWEPESDHETRESAASRVAWLNGDGTEQLKQIANSLEWLASKGESRKAL